MKLLKELMKLLKELIKKKKAVKEKIICPIRRVERFKDGYRNKNKEK